MSTQLHDDVVDGVRVLHVARDEATTSATLVFAVGLADEEPWRRHSLHLLEHLVMGELRRLPVEANAGVGRQDTFFTATGRSADVADFLQRVSAALAAPPLGRLTVERDVVGVEGTLMSPLTAVAHARFGHTGVGAGLLAEPAASHVTAEMVRAAARWFTADNAVLLAVGGALPGLRLPLSPGPVPPRGDHLERRRDRAGVVLLDEPINAVSLVLPPTEPWTEQVLMEAMRRRVAEAVRHGSGHSYQIDDDAIDAGAGLCWLLSSDMAQDRPAEARTAFVTAVRAFLADGPTADELAEALDRVRARTLDPVAGAELEVDGHLRGRRGREQPASDLGALDDLDLDRALAWCRQITPSLLWVGAEEHEEEWRGDDVEVLLAEGPELPLDTPLPPGRVLRPGRLGRLFSRDARHARLVVGEDVLSEHLVDGVRRIHLDDVVAVIDGDDPDEPGVAVCGRDGTMIVLDDSYPGALEAVQPLLERVGRERRYTRGPHPEH